MESQTNLSENGRGLGIGDYDNDGFLDIALSDVGANNLLRNLGPDINGEVTFENTSASPNIERGTVFGGESVTWGTAFFDHNNDGWLDLLFVAGYLFDLDDPQYKPGNQSNGQPNAFFANNRDGTFTDISASSGLDHLGRGRNASLVDFDDDGFVDVFIGNRGEPPLLMHNRSVQLGNPNHWIVVTVEGTDSNRDGIGARLQLTTPDGMQ